MVKVLQEIAAARHILIKCGIAEIDGYAFCSGLSVLRPFDMRPDLQALIPPVAYLIRGAVFRRKHRGDEIGQPDRFSLNIRPLSELVDMYHTRKATILLDKVYALSGMSSDDPDAAGLKANYKAAWRDTFRKLIHFCLSDQISVSTWDRVEATVIEAKGYIFGEVSSAGEDATQHRRQNQDIIRLNRQHVEITWKDTPSHFGTKGKKSSRFNLQASAKAVEKGDVVCLLQGASTPTIVRLCAEFSTIIIIAVPLTDNVRKLSASVTTFPTDLLLVWDWDESQRKSQGGEDYEKLISSREVPKCPVADCQCFRDLDKAIRLWNFGLLLNRMERYEEAVKNIREAVDAYGNREGLRSVDEACHCSLREASEEPLRIMGDLLIDGKSANIEAKYKEESQTPLSWAAENGHEPLTRLLVDKGANVEAKDRYGRTPLSLAAETGHEAVVRLLVDMGAHIEAKDSRYSRTPLSWAAWNGHEAVVRLLVDKGADIEAKSIHSWTPLLWAADKGHEAVVRLLVDKGANIEAKDSSYSRTPLSWAAWNGHEAVVRLLADKGADTAAKSIYSQTPLMLADQKGHEPVVRLLADKGASLGWEDDDGQALLLWAAWNGYEAVVRLLIDKGTSIEARDDDGQTPLSRAAEKGYEAIVRLLIDKGANVEAEDVHGKTSLWWAARGGHEAVVRLLKSREIRPS